MAFGSDISRRTALGLIGGQIAAASVARALPLSVSGQTPPNVILVLLDDVGYGDLACLGNPIIKTPNIDALHDKSIRFTDFHMSPTCAPTRASLLTGKYNDATGVWHTIEGRSILSPPSVTLADCFKSSGYRTGIYGKWHLGDNYPCRPHDRGFDDAVVCGGGGIWQTPDYFGNDDMDDSYLHNGKFQKYAGYSTDVFFDLSMDFMRAAQKDDHPFFCYLATTAAHIPCWAKERDQAPYEGVEGLANPGFYGMVANIDENMGRLMRFLEDSGLVENTILIFSSDNGTADGAKVFDASMRGIKGSPYDGGHRMPLFIYWPGGGIEGGKDIATLSAHIDVLPTLVELCQLRNHGKDVDGKSWQPLLYGSAAEWPDRTIVVDSQREENLVKWKDTAVMTQRWRLVNPSDDGNPHAVELYDIIKDPRQKADIVALHPNVVELLKKEYDSWWRRVSADGNVYVRIVIGSDNENPSRLDCMDWHGPGAIDVWNQMQIRTAPIANGFWALSVIQTGRYRFELRRWPRELNLGINAPYTDPKPNHEKTPGVAIAAKEGNIMIGDVNQTKPVLPGAKYVEFEVQLSEGPTELRTAFYDADLNERGAYYVYVERL